MVRRATRRIFDVVEAGWTLDVFDIDELLLQLG
jgi:hypothetical protein